jgi:hypothetical protein
LALRRQTLADDGQPAAQQERTGVLIDRSDVSGQTTRPGRFLTFARAASTERDLQDGGAPVFVSLSMLKFGDGVRRYKTTNGGLLMLEL